MRLLPFALAVCLSAWARASEVNDGQAGDIPDIPEAEGADVTINEEVVKQLQDSGEIKGPTFMGIKKGGKYIYGDMVGTDKAGRPSLDDPIATFLVKLGAPQEEADAAAAALDERWGITTALELKAGEPPACPCPGEGCDACEKNRHADLEEIGVPENGSRIVQNGLRFLEKDFAALEAEGKASRKSFGGAPQPAAPAKKTATERYEDVVKGLMELYAKLGKVEAVGGEEGTRKRLERYYRPVEDGEEKAVESVELFYTMVLKRFAKPLAKWEEGQRKQKAHEGARDDL